MIKQQQDQQPHMPHRLFRRTLWGISLILVRLLYRLEYQGLEHFPQSGPGILVSNHTSMVDMLAIHTAIRPWICWVAKKELFKTRFTAWVFSRLGCIPVDREKSDALAARAIILALRNRQIVGMFPQGTRVPPEQVNKIRPRSGAVHFAIKTGVPLIPVAIDGRFRLFNKVRIVYGQPFSLDLDPRRHYSADELNQLTIQMMRQVYALIGVDYQLAELADKE